MPGVVGGNGSLAHPTAEDIYECCGCAEGSGQPDVETRFLPLRRLNLRTIDGTRTRMGGGRSVDSVSFGGGTDLWMAFYCSANESRVLLTNEKPPFTLHNALI